MIFWIRICVVNVGFWSYKVCVGNGEYRRNCRYLIRKEEVIRIDVEIELGGKLVDFI